MLFALTALPVLITSMPPLTDLGGHLGRYAVQIAPGDPIFAKWYSFKWGLIPNLGVDLIEQVLAPLIGLERSLWYVVLGIPLLQFAGIVALSRVAHGRVTPGALFAVPLVYSYPFMFGFLNFTLGQALALCAAALWLWQDRRHGGWPWSLAFAPISFALWVCHLAAWCLLGVFALSSSWERARAHHPDWRAAVRSTALALWPLSVPLVAMVLMPGPGADAPRIGMTYDFLAKAGMLIMPFRDRWLVWDLASVFLVVGLIGWTLRSALWRLDPVLLRAGLLIGLGYLVSPTGLRGLWYVDMRIMPILMITLLLAARPSARMTDRTRQAVIAAGIAFAACRLISNAASFHLTDVRWQRELALLDHVPAGSTMVTLVHEDGANDNNWHRERRQHLAGFALARRHIYSNEQWEVPDGQLLRVTNRSVGPFTTDPSERVHTGEPGEPPVDTVVGAVPHSVGYLWMIGVPPSFHSAGWQTVARVDDVTLLRSVDPGLPTRNTCRIDLKRELWNCQPRVN